MNIISVGDSVIDDCGLRFRQKIGICINAISLAVLAMIELVAVGIFRGDLSAVFFLVSAVNVLLTFLLLVYAQRTKSVNRFKVLWLLQLVSAYTLVLADAALLIVVIVLIFRKGLMIDWIILLACLSFQTAVSIFGARISDETIDLIKEEKRRVNSVSYNSASGRGISVVTSGTHSSSISRISVVTSSTCGVPSTSNIMHRDGGGQKIEDVD